MREKAIFENLTLLKEQVDKLVEEKNLSEDSQNYQALQNVLRLIINEESFRVYFEEFNEIILSMLGFDFSKRLSINKSGDIFCYISTSLNLLNEELGAAAAPKHYLQEVLNLLPEAAMITDEKGIVQFINTELTSLTKFKAGELIGKSLLSLFKGDSENFLKQDILIGQREILYDKYLNYIPVNVGVKKMYGPHGRSNGFCISLKKMGEMINPSHAS